MQQPRNFRIYATPNSGPSFEWLKFSGGEMHVKIMKNGFLKLPGDLTIKAYLKSSDDVFTLLLLTDALRREYPDVPVNLEIPYLPYGRQDRVCNPGEPLSLRVMCDIINSQHYKRVRIADPHSDVSLALLDRAEKIDCLPRKDFLVSRPTVLVAPDAGARKRVGAVAALWSLPYVSADKVRVTATGAITETVVHSANIGESDFLIVDDICDGGRTFIELAKKLRLLVTTGHVNLYVTHAIFSAGYDALREHIDKMFVSYSFRDDVPDFVQIMEKKL